MLLKKAIRNSEDAALNFGKLGRVFSVSPKVLFFALIVSVLVIVVFGTTGALIGPTSASAGYLTLLFLMGAMRIADPRKRIYAALWALAVSVIGYCVGSLGLTAILIALVFVSLVQGLLRFGEIAVLTRSPVNLIAFTTFGQAGAAPVPLLSGVVIGCVFVLLIAQLVPARGRDPETTLDLKSRLSHGITTALGSVLIVWVSESLGFSYTSWALLSFCMILTVGSDQRTTRAWHRVIASVGGTIAAALISLLAAPWPLVVAAVCGILCVAYLRSGKYALFVLFLTPAVLLTTSSELAMWKLGLYRIEAVLFAAAVALACNFLERLISARLHRGEVAAGDDPAQETKQVKP